MPENPASYRVVRTKSYLFNKAVSDIYPSLSLILRYIHYLAFQGAGPATNIIERDFYENEAFYDFYRH
ncbi:hypothetical protein EXX72_23270 [Escherichia coli]|nr:hypothetical protein EXX72_23270 [Escherichia coli]